LIPFWRCRESQPKERRWLPESFILSSPAA